MSNALIQIRDLKKSYWLDGREIEVLRGLDLDIQEGERISITGASGSGKSTFLHVLGTLDTPSAGQVLFKGENVFEYNSSGLAAFRNKTIGFCFQFHHLMPEFSALENVMMPALIQRKNTSEAEANARPLWHPHEKRVPVFLLNQCPSLSPNR